MNANNEIRQKAFSLYKPPFKFVRGYIFDSNDEMVSDDGEPGEAISRVRGWGRIVYMEKPELLQDEIGKMIAEALTIFWNTHIKPQEALCKNETALQPVEATDNSSLKPS